MLRLVFGSAMVVCIVLGVAAVRRRDIAAHRAWMVRGYAIGLAAGTQAFTEPLGVALFGDGVVVSDLAKGLGWVVNLAVAEWVLRRRPAAESIGRASRRVGVVVRPVAEVRDDRRRPSRVRDHGRAVTSTTTGQSGWAGSASSTGRTERRASSEPSRTRLSCTAFSRRCVTWASTSSLCGPWHRMPAAPGLRASRGLAMGRWQPAPGVASEPSSGRRVRRKASELGRHHPYGCRQQREEGGGRRQVLRIPFVPLTSSSCPPTAEPERAR